MQLQGLERKHKSAEFITRTMDRQFYERVTHGLPSRWVSRIHRKWMADRLIRDPLVHEVKRENIAHANSNRSLRELVDCLSSISLPIDADDSDICMAAEEFAETIAGLSRVFQSEDVLRFAMAGYVERLGIEPPLNDPKLRGHVKDISAIARMTCMQWWRRKLRRLHAKVVEGAAISLGYVNRTSDCYVSNESLFRRIQQNNRNEGMLEATVAVNENGDQYTLAELSAKGVANKAIRRAELMTRIAGFEVIARDSDHVGLFITTTCPSRMHKWRTVGKGKVVQNSKYDGTQPNEAQSYLAKKVFKRVRSKWNRCGIKPYGFRIAEPNHDGTPHWHLLLFVQKDQADAMVEIMREYALEDSGDEAGAEEHRCKVVVIDWSRGSAAGYIAKYVAKNIDGYKVEKDLFGNDAIESSARVESWASTWGIRQFQQIGGAPVGVWRELRRVKELPENAPAELSSAWVAANRIESDGEDIKRADWAEYIRAQGGVAVGRNYKLRIVHDEADGGFGRYYEENRPAPIGVGQVAIQEDVMAVLGDEVLENDEVERMAEAGEVVPLFFKTFKSVVNVVAKSVRYCWEIMRKELVTLRGVGGKKSALMKAGISKFFEQHVMGEEAAILQRQALERLGIA